ncbi:MAG: hypothetical protein S4CHLAM20_00470 [Chlamydiia bacterium]|nr:hypothetical protein [Chlamydiia bacterium]
MKKLVCLFCMFISLFTEGFDYQVEEIDEFTKVHVIKVDPMNYEIKAVRAEEFLGISKKHVKEMMKKQGAKAAINGGFYKQNGQPSGILKCSGIWYGQSTNKRGSIGWKDGGEVVFIDRLLTKESDDKIVVVPQSDPQHTTSEDWSDLPNIVGGTPVLIRNGDVIEDYTDENITIQTYITKKHCRTAVGVLDDGTWVFLVAGGKVDGKSGLTIPELAVYMKDLGCKEAVSLCGGNSSRMVIDGKEMNRTMFYNPVSDAILIFPKATPS